MPRMSTRYPAFSLRLEDGWIIKARNLDHLNGIICGPVCRYWTTAICAEASPKLPTTTTSYFVICWFLLEEAEFVCSEHHNRRRSATAGSLTIAAMTYQLNDWSF